MEGILKKLQALSESDFYPYHMPGHKRNGAHIFKKDITEIDEFDNLHHATGIIKEAQTRAAKLYGAKESFFLVNGSTGGLLTAIFAAFRPGEKVLVARNCHKAVYHGLEIRGLEPVYIYPEQDEEYDINVGVKAEQVLEVLNQTDGMIKGMILTSPTYEGITSEVKEIAQLLHSRNMMLIVDEAHGAHFGFHEEFPQSAVMQDADLVIQSLHKTLPSMTQTALLHRCSSRVDSARIRKYLSVFQTSSPSYVFMAHMDECIRLLEEEGPELFQAFAGRLNSFYTRCEGFKHISVKKPLRLSLKEESLSCERSTCISDAGKIIMKARGYTGKKLYDVLRERYHLQLEMCAGCYALAIMTIYDSEEGFERLFQALSELDCELETLYAQRCNSMVFVKSEHLDETKKTIVSLLRNRPFMKYKPTEAESLAGETVLLQESGGRISKEYLYLYPPGIPYIVPGEVIDPEILNSLLELQDYGYELQGFADVSGAFVEVAVSEKA